MAESNYNARLYLSRYDLDVGLFEQFDLEVYDVYPMRKVFLLSTNKGDKILKKIDYTIEEFEFIDSALKYISKKYKGIMSFCSTKENKNYIIWNNELYCIMNMVEGRECRYSNPLDLNIASKGVGIIHRASEGFRCSLKSKDMRGKLIERFKRNLEEMKLFKKISNIYEDKKEFDSIFLQNADYYIDQIKNSIELLKKSDYFKLCGEEEKIVVCHHDLAEHNIMIDKDKANFIDFDYAIVDLKVHDLCNFINKGVKNFAFDIEKAKFIIDGYSTTNNIDNREFEVLVAMLTFPQDFYCICKNYYTKRKEWEDSIFLTRLRKKILTKYDREEFLEQLKCLKS